MKEKKIENTFELSPEETKESLSLNKVSDVPSLMDSPNIRPILDVLSSQNREIFSVEEFEAWVKKREKKTRNLSLNDISKLVHEVRGVEGESST